MSNRKRGDAEAICCETFLTGLTPQRASEAHRCWMICWKMPRITNASRLYSLHQSFQAGSYKKIAGIYNFDPRHMALPIRLPLFDHISDIFNKRETCGTSHYSALVRSQSSPRLVPTQLSAATVSGGKTSSCTLTYSLASSWLGHITLDRKKTSILRI